jgi:hypothetical protein
MADAGALPQAMRSALPARADETAATGGRRCRVGVGGRCAGPNLLLAPIDWSLDDVHGLPRFGPGALGFGSTGAKAQAPAAVRAAVAMESRECRPAARCFGRSRVTNEAYIGASRPPSGESLGRGGRTRAELGAHGQDPGVNGAGAYYEGRGLGAHALSPRCAEAWSRHRSRRRSRTAPSGLQLAQRNLGFPTRGRWRRVRRATVRVGADHGPHWRRRRSERASAAEGGIRRLQGVKPSRRLGHPGATEWGG